MKLAHAILILFLTVVVQVSLVRLLDSFSFAPNLSLIALFLLCYFLSFEKILILAIIGGISIDLSSSISFGSTSIAALAACSLSFYLRENILKGGRFTDFSLNNFITFSVFYIFLGEANILLKSAIDYSAMFKIINVNSAGELLLNFTLSVFAFYLVKYYKNGKNLWLYPIYQNIVLKRKL